MSLDAERTILGSILVDNQALSSATETLRAIDFSIPAHVIIFQSMIILSDKSQPIDLITLKNDLKRLNLLENAGGVTYLAGLVDGAPRLDNVDAWAKIVKNASTLRRLAQAGSKIAQEARESSDPPEAILDRAEALIFSISDGTISNGLDSISAGIKDAFSSIEKAHESSGNLTGISSGLVDLDRITNGFQNSDLIIVAARPSMGKTSLCLNIGRFAAESSEKPVAIFSLEMSKQQLIKRLIYSEARIDSQAVQRGQLNNADWIKLTTAWKDLNKLPIYIDDKSSINPNEVRAKCRRIKAEKGLGMVIIDYLQLMTSGISYENSNQDVSHISKSLKGLAKELDVPVICLSQLSRKSESRVDHRPQLSDLRDSGAIEQDADIVMFIYRDSVYKPMDDDRTVAELIVAKNRNGPTDTVSLRFFREFTKFDNMVAEF